MFHLQFIEDFLLVDTRGCFNSFNRAQQVVQMFLQYYWSSFQRASFQKMRHLLHKCLFLCSKEDLFDALTEEGRCTCFFRSSTPSMLNAKMGLGGGDLMTPFWHSRFCFQDLLFHQWRLRSAFAAARCTDRRPGKDQAFQCPASQSFNVGWHHSRELGHLHWECRKHLSRSTYLAEQSGFTIWCSAFSGLPFPLFWSICLI